MSKEQFIEKYGEECYYSHPIIHKCTVLDPGYGSVSKYYAEPIEPISYSGDYYVCKYKKRFLFFINI